MLRFKEETGREITQIDVSSFTDVCTYLWCCVTSASKREGKDFNMSLMDFADCIDPEDMTEWGNAISSEQGPDSEGSKKKRKGKESMN